MANSSDAELRELLAFALDLADEADRVSMSFYRGELGTTEKADGSLVTRADKAVEARLRELIAARYPEHSVLGEEAGYTAGASEGSGRWILDPIDGTHGFARHLPIWATLIAFECDGTVQVGVASAPALRTRWWAGRGLGAYRGEILGGVGHAGERIRVSEVDALAQSQVLYGELRLVRDRWPGALRVIEGAWRSRGFGDFWSHCLVAEGLGEVMLDPVVTPWDVAALIVIVEEAGGRLTDSDGVPGIEHGYAVTSNGRVHDAVLDALRE